MAGTRGREEYVPKGLSITCDLDDPGPIEVEHMGETLWITIRDGRKGRVKVVFDGPDFKVTRLGLKLADEGRVADRRRDDPPSRRGPRVDRGHPGGRRERDR